MEPGESDRQAVIREVQEEAGVRVSVGELLGSLERAGPDGVVFDIHDYAATAAREEDTPVPGDDASEVRWVSETQLRTLPTTRGLVQALTDWGVLSAAPGGERA